MARLNCVTVLAPAKLNLALDVVGLLPSGYHDLDMTMQAITLYERVVLRRSQKEQTASGELTVGSLRFYFNRYEAWLGKEKLELTPKEYELLKLFATNTGKVFTREQLLEKVWGYEYYGDTRTVDVHVRHLRMKLSTVPEIAEAIETVRGVGYKFHTI